MTLLFALYLSRHVRGMVKGPVKATECGIVGHYVDGKPYKPDQESVRNCLPVCYRAAFERSQATWWWPNGQPDGSAYCTLRDSRGRYLNTIYAIPYHYTAKE